MKSGLKAIIIILWLCPDMNLPRQYEAIMLKEEIWNERKKFGEWTNEKYEKCAIVWPPNSKTQIEREKKHLGNVKTHVKHVKEKCPFCSYT